MTINVAVKCPEGIVLGADSLISVLPAVSDDDMPAAGVPPSPPSPIAVASRHRKVFQLGRLPIGVRLNGDTGIQGRKVEDILAEFGAGLETRRARVFDMRVIAEHLIAFVEALADPRDRPVLELIVGGFSRGKAGARAGELVTLTWDADRDRPTLRSRFEGDRSFGAYFGGRPDPIFRFLYGFDRFTALHFLTGWEDLYGQTRDYVVGQLEKDGVRLSDEQKDIPMPSWRRLQPWRLLSSYDFEQRPPASPADVVSSVLEFSQSAYVPAYGFFSLPMAIDFAWHMLLVACAESTFLPQLPAVGSRLRIVTITRDEGFQHVWSGDAGVAP